MMDILVLLPAAIHIYIFALESLLWNRASTRHIFGISAEEALTTKLFAWNQGFYNLLLGMAIIAGWFLRHGVPSVQSGFAIGTTLVLYGLFSITVAGIVLYFSARRLWRSALVQVVPALIGLIVVAM